MDGHNPFHSVVGTNFVPSDSDVQLIGAYLVQPLSEVTQLDLEISRLQAKRNDIYARIQPYQALLSPIRRLPLDIMENIFLCCLPTQRNPAMSTLEAPLKLGRICSSWRSFAYSCPRLWARIHISVPHLGETPEYPHTEEYFDPDVYSDRMEEAMADIRRRLDCVTEWLARSQSHPLSISVFDPQHSRRNGALLPLLQTLLPFSKKWQDLELLITWDDSMISDFSQHFSLLELPIIRSVHLRDLHNVRLHFHSPSSLSSFKWFLMPSLRSFHALSLPSPLLANSGFHRLTLTELSLLGDLITPSDAALLLISCANIVKCALEVSLQHGSFNFNLAEPIELNRLESLTFCEKVGFPVSLHLPNLRNLSFGSYAHASIPRFDLPSTLHSGITTLILDLHTLTPELVLRSLSCASSLKCLTFSKWMGKTERIAYQLSGYEKETMVKVVEALTPTECDDLLVTTFCPNLEIFECEMFACFSDEALETMIVRRTSPKFQGSILRRVAVDFSRQPGDRHMTLDLWKSLENVVDESFELELEYLPESPVLISAWSGVGTEEMVPEWALDGISRN